MTTPPIDKSVTNTIKPEIFAATDEKINENVDSVFPNLLHEYLTRANQQKQKLKRVNLNVKQKLELIEKLEAGVPVRQVCAEYGIKRQTVSDIRKKKHELRQFVTKYTTNLFIQRQQQQSSPNIAGICERKHMKVARDNDFENAMYQWYIAQISNGSTIKSSDIRSMACKIAADMNLYDFKASEGWLWRFRNRLGIVKTKKTKSGDNPTNLAPFEFISVENSNKINDLTQNLCNIKQEQQHDDYSVDLEQLKRDTDGDIPRIQHHIDMILEYIAKSSDVDLQPYLQHFNNFRTILSKKDQI